MICDTLRAKVTPKILSSKIRIENLASKNETRTVPGKNETRKIPSKYATAKNSGQKRNNEKLRVKTQQISAWYIPLFLFSPDSAVVAFLLGTFSLSLLQR